MILDRELKVYGAILLGVLLAAFVSWRIDQQPNRPRVQTTVTALDIAPSDLAGVKLADEKTETTLTWKGDSKERYAWVDVKHLVVGTAAAPAPESFPGGDSAKATLGRYSPLAALRKLPPPTDAQKKEMGLETPKSTLSVMTGSGRTWTFKLGGTPYGSTDLFAQAEDGQVYLLQSFTVQPLQNGGGSLMERTLSSLDDGEIGSVLITAGTREIEYTQQNRQDRAKRFWARPKTPEKKEEQFNTWLGKVRRLPVMKYGPEAATTIEPKVKVVFKDEGGRELGRIEIAPGKVKSERTHVWAETVAPRVDEVLADVEAIVGAS